MPSALVFLAEGAEEMETVITVDVLRRAGVDVTLAGLDGKDAVTCSRNVKIVPDTSVEEALKGGKEYDALILPGGLGGADNLRKSGKVGEALAKQEKRGALVAAVCAGPTVLQTHGIGKGKNVTSHPSVSKKMEGYTYKNLRVVKDGKVITSQGPGTSMEFALKIAEDLMGKEKAESLVTPLLVKM